MHTAAVLVISSAVTPALAISASFAAAPPSHARLVADAAAAIRDGQLHRAPGFASPSLVAELRREVARLAESEAFRLGTSHRGNGDVDDMRRALTCTPDLASDSFSSVLARLSHLGNDLGNALGRRHASGIESAYVAYPPGGYYRRHRDSVVGVDVRGSGRRSTSFILYLTDPDLPWSRADGGALRIFSSTATAQAPAPAPAPPPAAAARASEDEWDEDEEEKDEKDEDVSAAVPGGVAEDVLPESGLLVIFDSKSLWHEVLPTSRHRLCLVGWFLHEA
jgi:hypothetical protein